MKKLLPLLVVLAASCSDTPQYFIYSDASTVADTGDGGVDFDVEESDTTESDAGETDADETDAESDAETDVADDTESDAPEPDVATTECGNDEKEDGEVCDGSDLGDATCVALGFDSGELGCAATCNDFDTSLCESECEPQCGDRVCGLDPVCGISCGTCAEGDCVSGECVVPSDEAPRIITFNSNTRSLTEGESIVFTAVVTDPDGIDNLIGGTLRDPISEGSYGAFATAASEGAYDIELTWGQMHRVRAIDFPDGEITRTFEAEFFDVEGNRATGSIDIAFHCDGDAACDGACTPLDTDTDCGACDLECATGASCSDERVCECPDGQGACDGECIAITTVDNCGGCGIECASGASCVDEMCECPEGFGVCGDTCVDLRTTSNCGACGIECITGGVCVDGSCGCPAGEADCDGTCTNIGTTLDCGECDNACIPGAACDDGSCLCPAGQDVCGGVCTSTTTTINCGGCGVTCPTGASCNDGSCECPTGQDVCGGVCTSITTPVNCGGCGVTCPAGALCVDGGCQCPPGESVCGGVCTSTQTIDNCGGCGIECLPDQFCTIEEGCTCAGDEVVCGGECVSLETTLDCGGCGIECAVGASCVDESCQCPPDHVVCDGVCTDITTMTDCTGCGIECPTGEGWTCLETGCECDVALNLCSGECVTDFQIDACNSECSVCGLDEICTLDGCARPLNTDLRVNALGNIEMYVDDEFLPVCGDGFGDADARAVCAQLGAGAMLDWEVGRSEPGATAGAVANLACTGIESWLGACPHDGFEVMSGCTPSTNAVRVVCEDGHRLRPCTRWEPGEIVINEFFVGADATERFVELRATPSTSLDTIQVRVLDADGNSVYVWTLGPSHVTDPDGLLVIGGTGVSGADLVVADFSAMPTAGGSIWVKGCDHERLDGVQYNVANPAQDRNAGEGDPAEAVAATESYGRNVTSDDTGDNATDFDSFVVPNPGLVNSAETIPLDLPLHWGGRMTTDSLRWFRHNGECGANSSQVSYVAYEIENQTDSTYELTVTSEHRQWRSTGGSWGGMELRSVPLVLGVFDETFTPSNSTTGCLEAEHYSNATIDFDLPPRATRWVVSSSQVGYAVEAWTMDVTER